MARYSSSRSASRSITSSQATAQPLVCRSMFRATAIPTGVLVLLFALGLAACGSDNSSSGSTSPPANAGKGPGTTGAGPTPLEGTAWVLGTDALGVQGVDQFTPTALFSAGTVSGNAGCNGYSGSYTLSGSSLLIGNLLGTQMSCGPIADAVETAYLAKLGKDVDFSPPGLIARFIGMFKKS